MSGESQQEVVNNQDQNQEDFTAAFVEIVPDAKDELIKPAVEAATADEEAAKAAEAEAARIAAEAAAKDTTDYKKLYEDTVQKTKSWEGRLSAADRRANEAEAKLREKEAAALKTPEKFLDEDEEKILKAFTDEMGEDFVKPLSILLKRAIAENTGSVKKEVEALKTTATAAKETAETIIKTQELDVAKKHWEAIETAHPDVEKLIDITEPGKPPVEGLVRKWAKTLPYEKAQIALKVIDEGNAEAVITLLNEYKKAIGKKSDAPAATDAQVRKAAAVKTGGPVIIPKTGLNKDDFQGTFEAITAEEQK